MTTRLTRDELYALVWSEPTSKVADRDGISDRGLGKLCARHDIPVPPRGWWARKAAWKRVKQDPLPPLAPGRCNNVIIEGQQHVRTEASTEPTPIPPEIAFERDPPKAIVVDENARLTHPLVKNAAKELRRKHLASNRRTCLK
jgi:hypothetical protein